jgi:hypothetical protein
MTELEKQFSINYYERAKDEFRREFDEDFPVLSTLPSEASLSAHEFLSSLPEDEQWRFALALLRRGVHREAAALCGEPFSQADQEFLDRYQHRTKIDHLIGTFWSVGPSKTEMEVKAAIESGRLVPQRSNKAFRQTVLKKVSESLGLPKTEEHGGANATTTLTSTINGWTVQTLISFSTKIPLRYSHVLSAPSVPGFNPYVSFLACLGIAGDTTWDLLTTDATPKALETLITLCRRFLSDAPEWLPATAARRKV